MVGVVVVWLCGCGTPLKVTAEANENGSRATQTVSCPRCGELQEVHANRIVSVAEDNAALAYHFPKTNAG
jgi:hypothetical protein